MNDYEVHLDDRVVGKAQFSKEGMFTSVKCTCKIPKNQCYDAFIKTTDSKIPLGILVPTVDGMGTQKRVLSKKLIGDVICINLLERDRAAVGIAVESTKPFPYISKIKNLQTIRAVGSEDIRLIIT